MTEREALLAAICANPDDDTPRLVYADWLQENGDPDRAEFIRHECFLVASKHISGKETDPDNELVRAESRSFKLNRANRLRWLSEIVGREPYDDENPNYTFGRFHRGFVDQVFVYQPEPFLSDWPLIVRTTPIKELDVRCALSLRRVLEVPEIGRLRELVLRYGAMLSSEHALVLALAADRCPKLSIRVECITGEDVSQLLQNYYGNRVSFQRPFLPPV
jgi:uncharacterized protein (TIGR02996 family)